MSSDRVVTPIRNQLFKPTFTKHGNLLHFNKEYAVSGVLLPAFYNDFKHSSSNQNVEPELTFS